MKKGKMTGKLKIMVVSTLTILTLLCTAMPAMSKIASAATVKVTAPTNFIGTVKTYRTITGKKQQKVVATWTCNIKNGYYYYQFYKNGEKYGGEIAIDNFRTKQKTFSNYVKGDYYQIQIIDHSNKKLPSARVTLKIK